MRTIDPRRGGALLAVLWLAAALSAIAFSVAATVRGETERASTTADGVRAYYLAAGAIDRACLWIAWGANGYRNPDGSEKYYHSPMPRIDYQFPGGSATVEVVPEAGKLNVNTAQPQEIERLLGTLGVEGGRARAITSGIIDWRSAAGAEAASSSAFAPQIGGSGSTFRASHASLEELEEILLIPAMTPEIFYGRYGHEPSGRLIPRGGLKDCLTVWGAATKVDVNTAPGALLESVGVNPEAVKAMVARRQATPFQKMEDLNQYVQDPGVLARLGIGGNSIWTLRATARVRGPNGRYSDLRRTVAAVVKLLDAQQFDPPYHILRWYDDAWSPGMPAF